MKSLAVMLKKEWMENVRTYKVISILITCSIFGILGPLTALMMPDIMAGILPKKLQGAIQSLPILILIFSILKI